MEGATEDDDQQRRDDQHHPLADAVGDQGGERYGQAEEQHADHLQNQKLPAVEPQRAGRPAESEYRHEIEDGESGRRAQSPQDELARIFRKHDQKGHAHPLSLRHAALECRSFDELQAYVEPHQYQHGTGQEGRAPAPAEHLRIGQIIVHQQEDAGGAQKSDRSTELREASVPRPLARRRVLRRQQYGAAPFTAQADTLPQSAERQQRGRKHPDGCVGRQQADAHGRNAHGQQGGNQRGLAPDAIAKMPEQSRSDGPGEECQRKGREGLQQGRGRIALGKEQPGEHQDRGRGVNIEVEEFNGRADEARKQDAARLRRAGPRYRVEQCRDSSGRMIPDISSGRKASAT